MSINTFDKNDMPNSERQQGLQVALASYKVQLRMIPISQLVHSEYQTRYDQSANQWDAIYF